MDRLLVLSPIDGGTIGWRSLRPWGKLPSDLNRITLPLGGSGPWSG